ncbi:unnamed protein product, partial [Polarella glacialis]
LYVSFATRTAELAIGISVFDDLMKQAFGVNAVVLPMYGALRLVLTLCLQFADLVGCRKDHLTPDQAWKLEFLSYTISTVLVLWFAIVLWYHGGDSTARGIIVLLACWEMCLCILAGLCCVECYLAREDQRKLAETELHRTGADMLPDAFGTRSSVEETSEALAARELAIDGAVGMFRTCEYEMSSADQERQFAEDECMICLVSFVDKQKVTRLPCRHSFHTDCIMAWTRLMKGP